MAFGVCVPYASIFKRPNNISLVGDTPGKGEMCSLNNQNLETPNTPCVISPPRDFVFFFHFFNFFLCLSLDVRQNVGGGVHIASWKSLN